MSRSSRPAIVTPKSRRLSRIKIRETSPALQSILNTETTIVLISSTGAIEGGRVLYTIGKIEAASSWHPEGSTPLQDNWRELILRDLIRKAEDIDADAIIGLDYQSDEGIRNEETGMNLKRIVATGIAVKLSCAA